jgi:UPF0271 protein
VPDIVPLGDRALRITLPDDADRAATLARLRALPGVADAVIAERHAAVYFPAPSAGPPPGLADAIVRASGAPAGRVVHVRVRYDGPDLAAVAAWAGLAEHEVIRRHAEPLYEARFLGFLPGFAYLGDVPEPIAAPRRATPRPRVPGGAVGIAGRRTGIYPAATPGGWNLVGTAVEFVAFDPATGAALLPGDGVRFEPL